jgi:hypothetical protein
VLQETNGERPKTIPGQPVEKNPNIVLHSPQRAVQQARAAPQAIPNPGESHLGILTSHT